MLYIVMLGGSHPRAKIEVHDIAFVNAEHLEDTYSELKGEWFGNSKGLHIDSWMQVDGVGDWKVEFSDLAPSPESPRLYFVNLGGYTPKLFGEIHDYTLIIANSREQAHMISKQETKRRWHESHIDAVLDIDDCLPIFSVSGRYINLVRKAHRGIFKVNEYIAL